MDEHLFDGFHPFLVDSMSSTASITGNLPQHSIDVSFASRAVW